jgi:hypothetical protein
MDGPGQCRLREGLQRRHASDELPARRALLSRGARGRPRLGLTVYPHLPVSGRAVTPGKSNGAQGRNRTTDTRIFSLSARHLLITTQADKRLFLLPFSPVVPTGFDTILWIVVAGWLLEQGD